MMTTARTAQPSGNVTEVVSPLAITRIQRARRVGFTIVALTGARRPCGPGVVCATRFDGAVLETYHILASGQVITAEEARELDRREQDREMERQEWYDQADHDETMRQLRSDWAHRV